MDHSGKSDAPAAPAARKSPGPLVSLLPALALAVFGLGGVAYATVAPSAGAPAAVLFSDDVPFAERLGRVAALGGRFVDTDLEGRVVYAVFEDVPDIRVAWSQGVLAVVDAAGAAGCTGQLPKLGMASSPRSSL